MQIVTSPGCTCCDDIKTYIKDVQKDFPDFEVEIIEEDLREKLKEIKGQ